MMDETKKRSWALFQDQKKNKAPFADSEELKGEVRDLDRGRFLSFTLFPDV